MKKIFVLIGFIVFLGLGVALTTNSLVYADGVDVINEACAVSPDSELCRNNQVLFGKNSIWTTIIQTLSFVIGGIAVLMMVIGGLKYVLSAGDQSAITSAKNTILYSAVGLIVVIMANAIVNFILTSL